MIEKVWKVDNEERMVAVVGRNSLYSFFGEEEATRAGASPSRCDDRKSSENPNPLSWLRHPQLITETIIVWVELVPSHSFRPYESMYHYYDHYVVKPFAFHR